MTGFLGRIGKSDVYGMVVNLGSLRFDNVKGVRFVDCGRNRQNLHSWLKPLLLWFHGRPRFLLMSRLLQLSEIETPALQLVKWFCTRVLVIKCRVKLQ